MDIPSHTAALTGAGPLLCCFAGKNKSRSKLDVRSS